jgi:hypothetical protein
MASRIRCRILKKAAGSSEILGISKLHWVFYTRECNINKYGSSKLSHHPLPRTFGFLNYHDI